MLGGVTAGSLLTTLGAAEAVAGDLPGELLARGAANATHASVSGQRGTSAARARGVTSSMPTVLASGSGFKETPDGFCYKNDCQDCYENVGGICVPEPAGIAPNGRCACGFTEVGGICVPRYPLPPR
jgi:hypothetical protein